MSTTNTNTKYGAITPTTTAKEIISSYNSTYNTNKSSYGSSSYTGKSYYDFNSYPKTKNTHNYEAVLPEDFKKILKMEQKDLKLFLYNTMKEKGYNPQFRDGFIYAKGELPVMLVAHMDTVHKSIVKEIYVSDCGNITSPQGIGGDNKYNIYMITQLMQHKPYILFTEDEEVGGVGAKKFAAAYNKNEIEPIDVKYLIELDRKGCNDMVFYECDNEEFEKYIGKFGWDSRYGTYSDICSVAPVIGKAAVNLSSGYYKAHTTEEIINIDDVMINIKRVRKMIKASKNDEVSSFKYVRSEYNYYYNYGKQYSSSSTAGAKPTLMDGAAIKPTIKNEDNKDNASAKTTEAITENNRTIPKTPKKFSEYCVTHGLDFYTDEGWNRSMAEYREYLASFKNNSSLKAAVKTITENSETSEMKDTNIMKESEPNITPASSNIISNIVSRVRTMFKRKEA